MPENNKSRKTVDEFAGFFFGVFLLLIAIVSVRAATVTNLKDTLTMIRVSAPANHLISFAIANGVAEGQTISITWPVEFNTVGLNENDVDITDDGTQLTTAPDCSGIEQASVVWTGNVLTVLICPGDGGSIALGSTVGVSVGTNAINSGIGVGQVENPGAAGGYTIIINGSSGNAGATVVPIVADDSINVTAGVTGGPITGGSGRMMGPVISDLFIDQITTSTARVSWKTDIASNNYVLYGLTTDYGAIRGSEGLAFDHSVTLMGLIPGYIYNIQARSMDAFGLVGSSANKTFSTLDGNDKNPPRITDIWVEYVTGNEMKLIWETDKPTYGQVEYGRTTGYGSIVEDSRIIADHDATLGNLEPKTLYHYRVISIDENGNRFVSEDYTFNTFDTVAPEILNIHFENQSAYSFDIVWTTDKQTTGGIKYGESQGYENGEIIEAIGYSIEHRVSLEKLKSNTLYHFKIFQIDKYGNIKESDDTTVVTLADLTPPRNAQEFKATPGDKNILLSWQNPPEDDFQKIIVRRKVGEFPRSTSDGINVYDGTGELIVDSKVINDTTYYYRIFSIDKTGNISSGAIARATPTTELALKHDDPIISDTAPLDSIAFASSKILFTIDGVPFKTKGNIMRVLVNGRIHIEPPPDFYEITIKNIFVRVNSDTYILVADKNGSYYTDIVAPSEAGNTLGAVLIKYVDGSSQYSKWMFKIEQPGKVFEMENDSKNPVSGASVSLYEGGGLWNGTKYGQPNPQTTDDNGSFRFTVPKNYYNLVINKPNYRKTISKTTELEGPITDSYRLQRPLIQSPSIQNVQKGLKLAINSIFIFVARNILVLIGLIIAIFIFLIIFSLRKRKNILSTSKY